MSKTFYYGWWMVAVAVLVQAVTTGTISYGFSVIATPISAEFNTGSSSMLMAMVAMLVAAGLLSPLLGSLLDTRSIRLMMLLGSLCLSAGYGLVSLTTAIWQVVCIYALLISVASLLLGQLASSTLVTRWFDARRGLALGIATMGTSLGGLVFPPLLQWMIDTVGWRMALQWTAAGTFLITVIPVMLLVRNRPDDMGIDSDGSPSDSKDVQTLQQHAGFSSTKVILRNVNFWLIACVVGVVLGIYNGILANFIQLASTLNVLEKQGAWLISLLALTGIFGKLIFGVLADRIDLRHGLVAAILLMIVSLLALDQARGVTFVAIACIPLGLATGGILPVWSAMLSQWFGADNYGRVMGVMSPVLVVFLMLGPLLAGMVFDSTGSFSWALRVSVILLVMVLVAITFLPARKKVQWEQFPVET